MYLCLNSRPAITNITVSRTFFLRLRNRQTTMLYAPWTWFNHRCALVKNMITCYSSDEVWVNKDRDALN